MSSQLEQVQRQVMKIIYGWSVSYSGLLRDGEVESLEERRVKAIEKFALKNEGSGDFGRKFQTEC